MLRLAAVTKATVVAGHHYRTAAGLSISTPKFTTHGRQTDQFQRDPGLMRRRYLRDLLTDLVTAHCGDFGHVEFGILDEEVARVARSSLDSVVAVPRKEVADLEFSDNSLQVGHLATHMNPP